MTDWGQLYRDHVDAVTALAGDLTPERLAHVVTATPEWTVHEVIAHLAGGPADLIAGRREGAPGPEWTARHVAEREGVPVPDLVAELRGNAEAVVASLADAPRPAAVWDIATHHADLHESLGLGRLPERFWSPIVDALAPDRAPELVGVAEPYELFRAIFSRRSRGQIAALGASPERVEDIGVFGPRDDDQPQPE